jgi:hypothetical protein
MIKLQDILKLILEEDRCKRIADRKYDKPSAYKSGAIVRCRQGDIWKDLKEEQTQLQQILDKAKTYRIPYSQFNQKMKTDWIPVWKDEYENDTNKVNEMVARHLLYQIAQDLMGGVEEIEFRNQSKTPTNHFQMTMHLGDIILDTAPFIYVDNNHKVIVGKTKIEILNGDYDTLKQLKEETLSNLTKIEPYNDPDDEYSQDLDDYLEDDNIDWRKESYITLLNPNQIQPSEWNSLSDDPKNPKSIKYSKIDPLKFPPILALKTGPNSYEAIDGIHRVYAFRLNNHMVPAVVITPKLEQGLSTNDTQMVNFMFNKYKDSNIPTPTPINLKEEETSNVTISQKIDQLPQGKLFNDSKNIEGIFKKSSHSWSEVIELFEKNKNKSKPEIIDIKDIHITQPNIQSNKVKNMLDKVNNLSYINVVEFEDGEKVIYDAHHRLVANWALGNNRIKVNLVKVNNLTEDESLHKWFKRSGPKGKEGGWVDCNAPIRKDGKITGYKACGRKEGEKRSKYPACRPTPSQCKTPGKGTKWGKTK